MIDFLTNLDPVLQALLATLFTWAITALGAGLVFFFKRVDKNILDAMLGFAAGVMIAASFFSLLLPAMEMAQTLNLTIWLITTVGFIGGGILLFISDQIFKRKLKQVQSQSKRAWMLVFSITVHNIPEGLAVGVAFGCVAYNLDGATLTSALFFAIGIALQNFPEGTAVSVPLRQQGYSRTRAFVIGQLSAIVEPIAGVIGALLVLNARLLLPFLLSFAAGAMIYVVVQELIPESQTNQRKDLMALFTLFGFALMMILDVAFR